MLLADERNLEAGSLGDDQSKLREEIMRIRLGGALLGLAISFASPTFGQLTNEPDPKLRERFISPIQDFTDALDKNDAVAMAGCFTEDATLLNQYERFSGRQAIEQWYAEVFKKVQSSNNLITVDADSPYFLGTYVGNELLGTGTWSQTINGLTEVKGSWSAIVIREGDRWKIRMLTTTATLAPAAIPSPPTASPSNQ